MSSLACAGCGGAIGANGVRVMHGDFAQIYCGEACERTMGCCVTRMAKMGIAISPVASIEAGEKRKLSKPAATPAPADPPRSIKQLNPQNYGRRKAAERAEEKLKKNERAEERRRVNRENQKDSSDDEDNNGGGESDSEDEEKPLPKKEKSDLPRLPVVPMNVSGVKPLSKAYLDFYAVAMKHFEKYPQIDPSPFDERDINAPRRIDELIGLKDERVIIHQNILGTISVPNLAERTGTRPTNMFLYGPGGTGKSALIKAMAREAKFALYAPTAASLNSEFQGESARLFTAAYYSAVLMAMSIEEGLNTQYNGVIFFLDEADVFLVEPKSVSGNDPSITSTFKQLIQSPLATPRMIVAAATNFPEKITDSAVLRRLPTKIFVGIPTRDECVLTAADAVSKEYGSWPRDCAAAQRATYDELDAAIRRGALSERIAERLEGHTPTEIIQIVAQAMGPESPLGLAGTYFEPIRNDSDGQVNRWQASGTTPTVGATDATSLDARIKAGDINVPVCWRVPDVRRFVKSVLDSPMKRSFTMEDMKRFYKYSSEVLVDASGALRLKALMDRERERQLTLNATLSMATR